ncbi:MAG: hypothetical protein HYV09_33620 [Deltaproteobacteria bacterium]|nr:hypothetical protein [Deltaproteobacteria bacterium]
MQRSRKAILERRARFVAAAMAATLPVAGCDKDRPRHDEEVVEPQVCLKIADPVPKLGKPKGGAVDASTSSAIACLDVVPARGDGGTDSKP